MKKKRRNGERNYRFEVDLGMLPAGASEAQLAAFCRVLQRVMDDGGTDLATVVPCTVANNDGAPQIVRAWGWPTEEDWQEAVDEVFGTEATP